MIRANVKEDGEPTMARFLNGLNHPIKRIADFQPYSNLLELVHQATKAKRQVQADFKYAKYSSQTYSSYSQAPATSTPPTSTRASPSTDDKSSSKQVAPSLTRPPASTYKCKTPSSSAPPNDPVKTSSFKCFTCGGRGHKSFECTNKQTMIFNNDGTYDSMSEEEMEALEHVAMHQRVSEDEDDQVFCDNDSSPSLVVSKVLMLQHHQE